MNATTTIDRLTEALTAPLLELGLDLEAVDLSAAGKRRVLRIAVDKDGGVEMDEIAEATREVSRLLDEGGPHDDIMGQLAYTLEVSSPGVDRPLTLPRHWRRNQTRLVKASLTDGTPVEGRIVEV
ncbi:MAG: ribosome maturation factor RimP, partial [Myxococcales bacterium]